MTDDGEPTVAHIPDASTGIAGRMGARSNVTHEPTPQAHPRARTLVVWTLVLTLCALVVVGGLCLAWVLVSLASHVTR